MLNLIINTIVIYGRHDNIGIANKLISAGENLNNQNINGYTPLIVGKYQLMNLM